MKKHLRVILASVLVIAMVFSLMGCGGSQEETAEPEEQEEAATEETAEEETTEEETSEEAASEGSVLVIYFSRTGEQYQV